jgi:ribosomal protein S27E
MNLYYNVYCADCENLVCHTSHPVGLVLCTSCLRERELEEEKLDEQD